MIPQIDVHEARQRMEEGVFLLDVREPYEWEAGHIEGAVHIPMGSLDERRDELPTDRPIVAVCRTDGRSGRVTQALVQAGYDASVVVGGMTAWAQAGFPMVAEGDTPPRVA